MRWRSLEGGLLCGVMKVMVCANEFLSSVPNADTPSMLRGFCCLFVASVREIKFRFFSGFAEEHNSLRCVALPLEQAGCFTHELFV